MSRDKSKFIRPDLIDLFIAKCAEAGFNVIITCVDRDYKDQIALYQQGREPLYIVNASRKLAGLPPISQADNQRKVTWTLNSKHIVNLDDERLNNDKSYAFDFAILKDKVVIWDVKADIQGDSIPDYHECGYIAESLGLIWGGRFKNPDCVHVEFRK